MVLLAPENMHVLLTAGKTTALQRCSSKSDTRRIIFCPSESVYSCGSTDGVYGQSGYAGDSRRSDGASQVSWCACPGESCDSTGQDGYKEDFKGHFEGMIYLGRLCI
jgi:hypothetical protein